MFQSSSAPKSGRYVRSILPQSHHPCFNPRPLRRADATAVAVMVITFVMFQSSFAPKSGRYGWHCIVHQYLPVSFNPRPPRRADATDWHCIVHQCLPGVSILVRPEERTLLDAYCGRPTLSCVSILVRPEERTLRMPLQTTRRLGSFNPRPPRRADATKARTPFEYPGNVSILVRPEERTLHRGSMTCTSPHLFQSSSAPKSGRYSQP